MPDGRRSLTVRLTVLQYVVAIAFASLAVAFWVFQIAKHQQFREMADNNFRRELPLPAPRGVLFDRDGTILVANQNTFNIVLAREQTKDIDQTLQILGEATGADPAQLKDIVNRKRREPSYRPIVLIENATDAQVIAMRVRSMELPGVDYQVVPTRHYAGEMGAHLYGYVGEVSDVQLQSADYKDLEQGAIIGKAGVEQAYNKLLMGAEGNKVVIVNSRGREIREVERIDPREGTRLMLTIDADVQKAAEDGFRHFGTVYAGKPYNGAAVILDPRSGEVLSLVSLPAYDPNKFAIGIDSAS